MHRCARPVAAVPWSTRVPHHQWLPLLHRAWRVNRADAVKSSGLVPASEHGAQ